MFVLYDSSFEVSPWWDLCTYTKLAIPKGCHWNKLDFLARKCLSAQKIAREIIEGLAPRTVLLKTFLRSEVTDFLSAVCF